MKTYRAYAGPFAERPYYPAEQIEQMCWDELNTAGLYPDAPAPVRIDRFIEKRFKISISYDDLPNGILGFTEFGNNGVASIVVAKALDDDSRRSERRIRTTLAHEAGHGLLHMHLMALGSETRPLFEDSLDPIRPRILCRNEGVLPEARPKKKYDGKWWEFQANQAMTALLLPRSLVERALDPMLVPYGTLGKRTIVADTRDRAATLLSETFDVNPIVARLRLDAIHSEDEARQLTL
jgi:hypothetical protein